MAEEIHQLHIPVLLNEILQNFAEIESGVRTYFDGTFGRGGHTKGVLERFPEVRAWAIDQDHQAILEGREKLAPEIESGRLTLDHCAFGDFSQWRQREALPESFDAALLDLGVSSPQLDNADRGFSFYQDGPLDMRMNQKQSLTASEILNHWPEEELIRIFREFGEVRSPYRVVRALVHDRKSKSFTSTKDVAELVARVDGWRKKGHHPATKYFQGLRIEVNGELSQLEEVLPELVKALADGGRLAVLTFHSLEDRIVKRFFKGAKEYGFPVNKKVIRPADDEQRSNSRARSAKLRVFERSKMKDL